ncbi:MAG: leucyl aminopeptidase [Candidatus Kariarchaeaceae archaeon]|jgi:aminopeptidase
MKLSANENNIETLDVDAIIIGKYEGLESGGAFSRLKDRFEDILNLGDFEGKKKQKTLLYNMPGINAKRVVLVGLGKKEDADDETVRIASAKGVKKLRKLGAKTVAIEALNEDGQSTAEGVILGLYEFDELKQKKNDEKKELEEVIFTGTSDQTENWKQGLTIGEAQNQARRLAELPANIATPSYFTEHTKTMFEGVDNISILVHDEKWAEEKKMGAFLSVTRGSDEPAKFLEIRYTGGDDGDQPLIIVGKGITFDTGGISLKPSSGMGAMRGDCGGAAATIGTLLGIAKLQLPLNVIGLTPLTENMPSGRATKPSDVVFASNGKSIEVENTDAEGRLILSDALVYAETFKPHTVIDIATLTGAIGVALGKAFVGSFTRSDELWAEIEKAGMMTHERFWRMPLDKIYRKQIDSTIADMKNSGGRPGGASTAAMFLGEFIEMERWCHLDIAGVMASKKSAYKPKGMAGFPVRALIQFARNLS